MALLITISTFSPAAIAASAGGPVNGATYFENKDNWNPNNEANDFGAKIKVGNIGASNKADALYPIEFKMRGIRHAPQESAYLLVRAYDVDEYDAKSPSGTGEWDRVYFSDKAEDIVLANRENEPGQTKWAGNKVASKGHPYLDEFKQANYIGALSGQNDTWNTTVLKIEDLSKIKSGDHYVGVSTHHYVNANDVTVSNWIVEIDWAQLVIDGGSRNKGEITNGSFTIDPNGNAEIKTWFTPKQQDNFSMEVNIVERDPDGTERNLTTAKDFYNQAGLTANTEKPGTELNYKIPNYSPDKEYIANIILFEDTGANSGKKDPTDPQEAQHIYSISTFDPKVANIEKNDSPQYEATQFSQKDFKEKFSKINGQQDNTLEKVKIVSLPDPALGRLVLGDDDVAAGDEIPTAELDNLKFVPAQDGSFKQPVTFKWNGYDQSKQKYAQFDADVTITPNLAPILEQVVIPANKGEDTIPLGSEIKKAIQDGDAQADPKHITILSLPSPDMGKLTLGSVDVTQGMEILWADLGSLVYIPADKDQTGTVSFIWNASDGVQYAKNPEMVRIQINNPPVSLDIAKPGLEGQIVTIPASDFKITDADGDALKSIEIVSVDASQGKLQYNTVTDATYRDITGKIDVTDLANVIFIPVPDLPLSPPVMIEWQGGDGKQNSENTAKIIITYDGRPVANAQLIEIEEGTPAVPITLTGQDAESLVLGYDIVGQPAKGTLETTSSGDHVWTYTPNSDFIGGKDTFSFTVTDDVYSQVSEPAVVTIQMNRTLDGWVGEQNQGDNQIITAIPGKPLKLSAVSSLKAQQVNAIVNGVVVPLTEVNPQEAETVGYKTWSNSSCALPKGVNPGNCVLPMDTTAGTYTVTFEAYSGSGQELPPETKLQDNQFKVTGTELTITANPAAIPGDGKSTTELTAVLKDGDGKPVKGVQVVFDAPAGQGEFIGSNTAVTDEDGKAVVTFKSPQISGVENQSIAVTVTVDEPEQGLYGEDHILITFQPATIKGVITEGGSRTPVSNTKIQVTLDLNGDGKIEAGVDFIETVITDANGAYSLPVPKGDAIYHIEFMQDIVIGGVRTPVTFKQKAVVDKLNGNSEVFDSDKTVTGIVLFKNPDGKSSLLGSNLSGHMKVYLKDENGHYITDGNGVKKPFELGAEGVFSADGLVANQKYSLEIWYEMEVYDENGPTGKYKEILINGKRDPQDPKKISYPEVRVTEDGELNIVQELVDPYGTITDGKTKAAIEGADVTLYYANTARNKANGITANTKVYLPPIADFAPNGNASPGQKSDMNGFYAYMVYPETDYYLTVTKNGYNSYTSPTIEVNWDIVKHDVQLYRPSGQGQGEPSPVKPEETPTDQPAVSLNLSVDKNLIQEGGQSKITVNYKNESSSAIEGGKITIQLPEGVEVVDAAGGLVDGNTITWTVGSLTGKQSGIYEIVLKWPNLDVKEVIYDVKGIFTAGFSTKVQATSMLKIKVFSTGFEHLNHQRYILGYPDGEFKPNRSLTRAELAAIVARLTENNELSAPLNYKDVPADYWAANYIKIATKHGYFNGFADGTFRPDAKVTRGELASVMTRFLKLDISKSGELHFNDIEGYWAADAIEGLYRNQFLSGYPDGSFKPKSQIIRSEAVTLINRMLYRGPLQGVEQQFPDMPKIHWAFGDVQEATISHESERNSDGIEEWIKNISDDVK